MKCGKVPENVLKRSVFKNITRNSASVQPLYMDANEVDFMDKTLLTSVAVRQGGEPIFALFAVHAAVNNIYAKFGTPIGITIGLTLTEQTEESALKQWISMANTACRELQIEILSGHTCVSKKIEAPIITITAIGRLDKYDKKEQNILQRESFDEFEILIAGNIGKEGTARLVSLYQEELKTRYAESFLESAVQLGNQLSIKREVDLLKDLAKGRKNKVKEEDNKAKEQNNTAKEKNNEVQEENNEVQEENNRVQMICHDCSEGGIFAALWELGEMTNCGMTVDLKKIPLCQETIEVCEFLNINPYLMQSGGCLLIAVSKKEIVLKEFLQKQIPIYEVGSLNKSGNRILINEEETRFLEPFRGEELYKADKVL